MNPFFRLEILCTYYIWNLE